MLSSLTNICFKTNFDVHLFLGAISAVFLGSDIKHWHRTVNETELSCSGGDVVMFGSATLDRQNVAVFTQIQLASRFQILPNSLKYEECVAKYIHWRHPFVKPRYRIIKYIVIFYKNIFFTNIFIIHINNLHLLIYFYIDIEKYCKRSDACHQHSIGRTSNSQIS